ncbi:MAG TPA: hypothetical protein VI968_04150 [archaeon]|nr:hypothetical protein [archaeon]
MDEVILLDTNMLIAAVQFKAKWPDKSFTLSSCVDELEKIALGKKNDSMHARASLKILKLMKIPVENTDKKGDTAILNYALRQRCPVATNDKKLLRKLQSKGIKVFRLRQKKLIVEA